VYILAFVLKPAPSLCVCTSLRMASRQITRRYDAALAPLGLTTNGYSILARLEREGSMALGELAARLAMDRTTLSREIVPLVDAGLLATTVDANDRRRRVLELTDAGDDRVRRARPRWRRAQQALTAEFGDERTAGLVRELHALVGAG
jgi:DNA-binding MarR family transcriptional regulator